MNEQVRVYQCVYKTQTESPQDAIRVHCIALRDTRLHELEARICTIRIFKIDKVTT